MLSILKRIINRSKKGGIREGFCFGTNLRGSINLVLDNH